MWIAFTGHEPRQKIIICKRDGISIRLHLLSKIRTFLASCEERPRQPIILKEINTKNLQTAMLHLFLITWICLLYCSIWMLRISGRKEKSYNDISFNLKVCAHYFIRNFYSSPNDRPSKTMKHVFYFMSFRSWDIHIFLFPPSPLFLPVSHCLRAWLKINLKVYDAINCLNKNLITHFVWYLEKEKSYHVETLVIDTVLNKKHFSEKIMQKMCTKC